MAEVNTQPEMIYQGICANDNRKLAGIKTRTQWNTRSLEIIKSLDYHHICKITKYEETVWFIGTTYGEIRNR